MNFLEPLIHEVVEGVADAERECVAEITDAEKKVVHSIRDKITHVLGRHRNNGVGEGSVAGGVVYEERVCGSVCEGVGRDDGGVGENSFEIVNTSTISTTPITITTTPIITTPTIANSEVDVVSTKTTRKIITTTIETVIN